MDNIQQALVYLLQNAFGPLQVVTQWGATILGIVFIIIGTHRLHHHGQGMMQKHHSPLATAFYFIAGASLTAFNNFILAGAQSVFGNITNFDPHSGQATVLYYINEINNTTDTVQMVEYFTYGILVTLGILSFMRGLVLLVKLGEGQAEGSLPKAVTHIVAGIVGVDSLALYTVLTNFISGIPS